MMKRKSLLPLAVVFALGGLWDVVAGILYVSSIGTGRAINNPPTDPFYAVFIGSFFFCFAYIQILSAANIRRYLFNVGCLIFGRLFYAIMLYAFIFFKTDFPATYSFTGILDLTLVLLYVVFSFRGGIRLKTLFLPVTR